LHFDFSFLRDCKPGGAGQGVQRLVSKDSTTGQIRGTGWSFERWTVHENAAARRTARRHAGSAPLQNLKILLQTLISPGFAFCYPCSWRFPQIPQKPNPPAPAKGLITTKP
jgi:hypothetical protein